VYLNPRRYPWLPATVSDDDPHTIEIVWDEVPDEMAQISRQMSDQVAAKAELVRRIQEQAGMAAPPAPAAQESAPAQAADAIEDLAQRSDLPPAIQAMLRQAARTTAGADQHLPPELRGAID
jgi:hypothetical protein